MVSLGVNTLPLQNVTFECNFRMYSRVTLNVAHLTFLQYKMITPREEYNYSQ